MPDREKVINDLNVAKLILCDPQTLIPEMRVKIGQAITSAIDLLEKQEPVLLKNQHKSGGHFINANSPWKSTCPRCGKKIEGKQTRFCKYCGLAVRWE